MKFNFATENINYLKLTYKDRDGFAHCTKSAIRKFNDIEILASARFEKDINIQVPQEIELDIACDNGLYKSKTILSRVEKDDPYIFFTLKSPENIEYKQKREFFRIKLQENINILFENENQEIIIPATIYDISANGVRIELDKHFAFPENVKLTLFLPKRNINTDAKYIRTDEEDNIIKASFKFENINSADLDYISQICIQKQLEERRKNLL